MYCSTEVPPLILATLLQERDDPKLTKSKMLIGLLPVPAPPQTIRPYALNDEPSLAALLMLCALPSDKKSKVEIAEPRRANARIEKDEPISTKSRTDMLAPNLIAPLSDFVYTLNELPSRTCARQDIELPTAAKESIDMLLPARISDRTDKLEPIIVSWRMESFMQLPICMRPVREHIEPSLTLARTLIELPH
jgi:hypothetical protein